MKHNVLAECAIVVNDYIQKGVEALEHSSGEPLEDWMPTLDQSKLPSELDALELLYDGKILANVRILYNMHIDPHKNEMPAVVLLDSCRGIVAMALVEANAPQRL